MSSAQTDFLTPAEYLEIERHSEIRHEYIDGRMYAMSGASRYHNTITLNIATSFRLQMRGRNCDVYIADMRVRVGRSRRYVYPDVVAVCGSPQFQDAEVDTLLNPTVIVEVLSETTETYDRVEKFDHYRTIESFREYVLVAQSSMRVDHYVLRNGEWVFSAPTAAEDRLSLPSIGCEISLADIYENVEFPPKEKTPPLHTPPPASR